MRKLCIFHRGLFVDLLVSRRACRAAQKSWLFAIARALAQKSVYAKEKFEWRLLRVLYVLRVHILARLHTFMYKLLAGLLSRALLQPASGIKVKNCVCCRCWLRAKCVCVLATEGWDYHHSQHAFNDNDDEKRERKKSSVGVSITRNCIV